MAQRYFGQALMWVIVCYVYLSGISVKGLQLERPRGSVPCFYLSLTTWPLIFMASYFSLPRASMASCSFTKIVAEGHQSHSMPCSSPLYLIFFLLLLFCFPCLCFPVFLAVWNWGWVWDLCCGGFLCVGFFFFLLLLFCFRFFVWFVLCLCGSVWVFLLCFPRGDSFQVLQVFMACHFVPLLPVSFVILLWAAVFSCFVVVSNFLMKC